MSNLDKPSHGWESLNNGGEIYGQTKVMNREDAKLKYLDLIKKALEVSMEDTPDAYEKSKFLLAEAERLCNDFLLDSEDYDKDDSEDYRISNSDLEDVIAKLDEEIDEDAIKKIM